MVLSFCVQSARANLLWAGFYSQRVRACSPHLATNMTVFSDSNYSISLENAITTVSPVFAFQRLGFALIGYVFVRCCCVVDSRCVSSLRKCAQAHRSMHPCRLFCFVCVHTINSRLLALLMKKNLKKWMNFRTMKAKKKGKKWLLQPANPRSNRTTRNSPLCLPSQQKKHRTRKSAFKKLTPENSSHSHHNLLGEILS